MKRYIPFMAGVLLVFEPLLAQNNQIVMNSSIKSVTVFADRALITRTLQVTLEKGSFAVLAPRLPSGLVDNSVRVSGKGTTGAKISGVRVEKALQEESSSDRIKEIEAQIGALDQRNLELTDRSGVLKQEADFIKALSQKTTESISKGLPHERPSVADWPGMIKFVDDNLTRINKEIRSIEIEQRDIVSERQLLESKLGDYRSGNVKSDKKAIVDLTVEVPGSFTFELSYMIYGATWHPMYDIRAWSDTNEVEVIFMAQVSQQTGEDWENVDLVLSTARPSEGANPPQLAAWYLNVIVPGRDAHLRGGRAGESLDIAKGIDVTDALRLVPGMVAPMEQAITQYSSAMVQTQSISTSFVLINKEIIPSNKEFKKVPVKSISFKAETENYIVPRFTEAAYLKASVKSNVDFPLLAGQANVFFDKNFVSTSYLPNVLTDETFDLFFGINEGIKIKRQLLKKYTDEAGLMSEKRRVEYEYEITAQNYTKTSQKLIVLDQIPVSQNEKIEVKLITVRPDPKYEVDDKARGFLRWVSQLNSGEKMECGFKYQVKYPLDVAITGLE